MAKPAFEVADIRLPTDLLASTEPIGQATLGIPFPPTRMHASSWTCGSTEIGFCTASHEVRPLFFVIIGLGEEPNPCRECQFCAHLERIMFCQVPLQVPFLPILASLHSYAQPAKARL